MPPAAPTLLVYRDIFRRIPPSREELEAFCSLFGEIDAPLGKYYVLALIDLFHHWRSQASAVRDLERAWPKRAYACWKIPALCYPAACASWRKDYLYTMATVYCRPVDSLAEPDDRYTVWLDHEPRDFKNAQLPVRI